MTVNVYHKHSVVKDKAPDAKQVELGEIAVNANQDSAALFIKDSADKVVKVGGDIGKLEQDIKRIKLALKIYDSNSDADHESYEEWLTSHDNTLNTHKEHLEAIDVEIEELKKTLALLQAGDDKDIENLEARVEALETSVDQIAKDVNKIDNEQEQIKVDLVTLNVALNQEVEDRNDGDVALSRRIDELEAIKIEAGPGIKITNPCTYEYKIKIDEKWLTEFLEDYLKKNIAGTLPVI